MIGRHAIVIHIQDAFKELNSSEELGLADKRGAAIPWRDEDIRVLESRSLGLSPDQVVRRC